MDRTFLRTRILTILGSSVAGLALSGCGGDTGSDASSGGSTSSGGSSSGGSTSSGGATGTGGSTSDCYNPGPGTCCTSTQCLAPAAAWALAAPAADGGAGAAGADAGSGADAGQPVCPAGNELPSGLCYWYGGGSFENGECCYSFTSGSCCGRPLLVEGKPLLASVRQSDQWALLAAELDEGLDQTTRSRLLKEWLEDARLEHASIASFALFALELTQQGAPPSLLLQAQQAMADEVRHASACFGLASRYAGRRLGPGPLPPFTLAPRSLAEIAAAAVREGCVGETLAVFQAQAQRAVAHDEDVQRTLDTIAHDEANHAELAWAFVRWAQAQGGRSVRRAVERAFEESLAAIEQTAATDPDDLDVGALHAHGRLLPSELRASHLRALREVIEPCRRALLGSEMSQAASTDTRRDVHVVEPADCGESV